MLQPDDVKIDHYASLGITKDTDLTKIRGAYRKLALSLHPDKIKDDSQREAAREEWHRVQKAYEILSDEKDRSAYDSGRAKYLDKEAKLAELKRELREHRRNESSYASPRGSGSTATPREMRNGHYVEERVPLESFLDEAMRFTDEPNPMGRKHEDFGRRTKTKPTDDRKKARAPTSSYRAAKDQREYTKATQADRAKKIDRERRRDASAKYQDQFDSYSPRNVVSDTDSDSGPDVYVHTREPSSSRRTRESRSRPTRTPPRRREAYYDDDEYDYDYSDQYDGWQRKVYGAQEHIQRSKFEGEVRPRASRSPPRRRGYESVEPETSSSRRAARSSRSTRDRSSSRNNSYERLDSPRGGEYSRPKMTTATTSPGPKSSMRPSIFTRATSATATAFARPKRESSSRNDSILEQMAHEQVPPSRSSKLRNNDSGYSSSGTPEMPSKPQRGHSPKVTARYTIDPETITIEPSKSRHRMVSPDRNRERERDRDRDRERDRDRPSRGMPKRASTFAEPSRIEIRSVKPNPTRTYTDVEYTRPIGRGDINWTKEVKASDASYSPSRHPSKISPYYSERHPPSSRRQSTAA